MRSENSNAHWTSCRHWLPLLATAVLLLAVSAPVPAQARSLVPKRDAMSTFEARHLLARLYSYSEDTLPLAEAEYRRLLAGQTDDVTIATELAEVLVRLGRSAEADTLFRTLDMSDPRVALGLGDTLYASGQMAEAGEAYARAQSAGATRPDLRLRLAQSLSWSGQPERALPYLAELHAADPANLDVALLYVQALTATGQTASARTVLDELAATSPDNHALLLQLADREAAVGHIRAARDYTLRALALSSDPETALPAARNMNWWGAFHRSAALHADHRATNGPDPAVARAHADTLSNGQRYEEAEGILRRLLLDNPDDHEARLLLAEVKLREKDGQAALDVLAPVADQDDPEVQTRLARAHTLLGQYGAAAAILKRYDDDPAQLVELGRIHFRAGDTDLGREAFSRATSLAPDSPVVRYHQAWLAEDGNMLALADTLAQGDDSPTTLTRWAELFSRDGYYEAAVICLQAGLERDPDYFPARMGLAENLAYAGHYDRSLALLGELTADYPDSSKIRLTRARVLAWSRRYDEAIHAYEALHASAPADPVPLMEMARTAFWDKQAAHGAATYERLLEPPVDEQLAERLEKALAVNPGDAELAQAAKQARQSAMAGSIYDSYAFMYDESIAESHPQIFADLLPAYRVQATADLERRGKLLAFNRRFAPAMDELTALVNLRPGNQEAWFDLAQTRCALGLCGDEAAAYKRLLEIEPQHALAAKALERRERRNAPWVRAGLNFWQEYGRGNLSNIARLRSDLQASAPVTCGWRVEASAHHWLEMPQEPNRHYEAFGNTLAISGVFNEWLSGSAGWTAKRFTSTAPRDTDQFRGRLEVNLRDAARVGVAFERMDEVANRFALLSGTQSDHFILDARVSVTRRLDVEGGIRRVQYSDDNTGERAHLLAGYAFTDHPRIIKLILRGDYRHTAHTSTEVFSGADLTDIIHPYWTPQGYLAGTATIEWYEDLAADSFCGARRHFLDVKLSGGTDSDTNNSVQLEAEWVYDITDHWGVEARGLWHRSREWDANGVWTGVRYGF